MITRHERFGRGISDFGSLYARGIRRARRGHVVSGEARRSSPIPRTWSRAGRVGGACEGEGSTRVEPPPDWRRSRRRRAPAGGRSPSRGRM